MHTYVEKVTDVPGCNLPADFCIFPKSILNPDILEKMLQRIGYELVCEDMHLNDKPVYYVRKKL